MRLTVLYVKRHGAVRSDLMLSEPILLLYNTSIYSSLQTLAQPTTEAVRLKTKALDLAYESKQERHREYQDHRLRNWEFALCF